MESNRRALGGETGALSSLNVAKANERHTEWICGSSRARLEYRARPRLGSLAAATIDRRRTEARTELALARRGQDRHPNYFRISHRSARSLPSLSLLPRLPVVGVLVRRLVEP
jgi:hypothetical protein